MEDQGIRQLQHCYAVYNQTNRQLDKRCILPFLKKVDLGIAKNYWGITLTSSVAKIYYALPCNHLESKIEKILWKNQNRFRRNRSMTSLILTIRWILEGVCAKKTWGNNIIHWLLQGIWFHTQRRDRANTSRLRSSQWNRRSHNDAI